MAGADLTPLIVTYTYICFSISSTKGRPPGFKADGMLPYRYFYYCYPAPSVSALIPDYYPCTASRLVSCYALFR